MYRRSKFLEVLHQIREEMSRAADYDMDLFAQMARSGQSPSRGARRNIRGVAVITPTEKIEPPVAQKQSRNGDKSARKRRRTG